MKVKGTFGRALFLSFATVTFLLGGAAVAQKESAPEQTTLQGGVRVIEVELKNAQEVGLDIKRVRNAVNNLYDEVTMPPLTYNMPPNVVGSTVINIPVHINYKPMEPRKKWVDRAMGEIEPTVSLMKQDVDDVLEGKAELVLPEYAKEELRPLIKQWTVLVKQIDGHVQTLKPLTVKAPYDTSTIATKCGDLTGDMKKLEGIRKQVAKVLRDAEKRAAKGNA